MIILEHKLVWFVYTSVVQPIRHMPHVANGHFIVANGFVSECIQISKFFWKNGLIISFHLISHFLVKNLKVISVVAQDINFSTCMDMVINQVVVKSVWKNVTNGYFYLPQMSWTSNWCLRVFDSVQWTLNLSSKTQ